MKIGVSGASGHLGRAIVSELLQRPGEHEVVAITRTPETVSGPAQGRGEPNRPALGSSKSEGREGKPSLTASGSGLGTSEKSPPEGENAQGNGEQRHGRLRCGPPRGTRARAAAGAQRKPQDVKFRGKPGHARPRMSSEERKPSALRGPDR
jgi:hypothetical protein